MEYECSTQFLFDISKEVKHFYETPVIFFTRKDFSDIIFNTMCSIRSSLTETIDKEKVMDIIVDFHLQWLHGVNEIENFRKRVADIPRDEFFQAVSYTIDAMGYRLKYYQNYMQKNKVHLTNDDQADLLADMELVDEMHKEVTLILLEKLKCFRNYSDDDEFLLKVDEGIEELLQWLDKINDGLAIQLSKYINFNLPHLSGDLTKTLQQIVDELQTSQSPSAQKLIDELKEKGRELGTMLHCTAPHTLEINKVVHKINILEDRIQRLEQEQSSAVMALKHKKDFLERRLYSLENLKINLKEVSHMSGRHLTEEEEEELCVCEDFYQLRIFNHALPPPEREQLVTELCYLWDLAVHGERSHKSIISILSAADVKEEYTDEIGTYYIDEHSRKIYKKLDDDTPYQPNEQNILVPVCDDSEHVYFYDECGRYFIDSNTRERIYKAHGTTSEYIMDSAGVLLIIKEELDGVTYYYDNCGRYYINSDGKHIYREPDTLSEYENDGLGNLVRIRSHLDIFEPCPEETHVTDDCKYLKQTVGTALRECIAEIILRQPADPIKYLSARLIKYRENVEFKQKLAQEKEELEVEREIRLAEERAAAERAAMEAAMLDQGGSETSYDSNLANYASMNPYADSSH